MPEHKYTVAGRWSGSRNGIVTAEGEAPAIDFSAPPEFQGEAGKWTPEHFFLAALTSCFVTTFRAICEFSKFEFKDLRVATEGSLEKAEGGFRFKRVFIRPALTVAPGADPERALRLLEKAERGCLISRSVSCEIVLDPSLQTASEV
jgi:peroxiredoxin-like protein